MGPTPGPPPPRIPIPPALGRGIAIGMELWSSHVTHKEPLATLKGIQYMQRNVWFDPGKARRELGLPTRPLRESVQRAVAWFRDVMGATAPWTFGPFSDPAGTMH